MSHRVRPQLVGPVAGRAIAEGLRITIQTQVEVERLVTERAATLIAVLDRASGRRFCYRAKRCALRCGAIGSSMLLLRSGLDNPMIGRNYMMHLCSVSLATIHESENESSFIKQVGFADSISARRVPDRMGLIQSLPVPGPLMSAKMSPFVPDPVAGFSASESCHWRA